MMRVDEYFMEKFEASSVQLKCQSIYENYEQYEMAQIMAERTSSKVRQANLDDMAEVNFRQAGQKLKKLNESELTTYLRFVKDKMLIAIKNEKEDSNMLSVKLRFGTILRQLPQTLTLEQQTIKQEMEEVLSTYFVKIENVM